MQFALVICFYRGGSWPLAEKHRDPFLVDLVKIHNFKVFCLNIFGLAANNPMKAGSLSAVAGEFGLHDSVKAWRPGMGWCERKRTLR